MRTISARDQSHLDTGNLTTATLWKITRRDGQVFTFTDHDQDIEFGGLTYDAGTSYNRTATADDSTMAPSNMVIESVLDSVLITEDDVIAGLWDYAQVEMRYVNWHDRRVLHISNITKALNGVVTTLEAHGLSTGDTVTFAGIGGMTELHGTTKTVTVTGANTFTIGTNTLVYGAYLALGTCTLPETSWGYRKGRIGQVNTSGQMFSSEFMGLMKQLEKNLLRPYLPSCPANFGDTECGVNLATYTHSGTIGSVSANGLTITDAGRLEASGYFNYGLITMTSGDSSGYSMEVKSYTPGYIVLQQPLPFGVAEGDTYSIRAGCDKTKATCKDTFNNLVNFRGFPDMPGMDKVMSYGK